MSSLNLSWVTDCLAVGGSFRDAATAQLARHERVRHVVDLRIEAQDDENRLREHGIELLHLPTRDHHAVIMPMIDTGIEWVAPRLERGERVLVHCEHGIGRSVLLTMCVLVYLGDTPLEAIWRIKRARPCASPSPVQLEAFLRWARPRVHPLPTWDELAAIAYRGIRAATNQPSPPPRSP